MVNFRDIAGFSLIAVAALAFTFVVAGFEIEGTNGSTFCEVPLLSDLNNNCSTEVSDFYDISTSIDVYATDVNANLVESSFNYQTEKSGFLSSLSIIGPGSNLAFGGADQVEIQFQLVNSDDVVVADGSKFIGEIGAFQRREDITFSVDNQPPGDYTVNYKLTYIPDFGVTQGSEQVKTLEKNIRVPKRIE